jgi:SAM-dependent methyltransferase
MPHVKRLVEKLLHSIRSKGFSRTLQAVGRYSLSRRYPIGEDFDRRYGVETAGRQPIWAYDVDLRAAEGGSPYEPVDEHELESAIERLGIDTQQFIFIDLGCGKGKALIVASKWKFRQLIGVELIGELSKVAEKNLRHCGIDDAAIFNMDVRSFRFPSTNIVVFMNNPFDGVILEQLLNNLKTAQTKEIRIIYYVPGHSAVLDRFGILRKTAEFEGSRTKHFFQIWSNNPT